MPEPRAWRLRAWDDEEVEKRFLSAGVIAISNDELGDLSHRPDEKALQDLLRASPQTAARSPRAHRLFVRWWHNFLHAMQPGDVVAVPLQRRLVAIGEITGAYRYITEEPDPRLRHTRSTQWLAILERSALSEDLRAVVNAPGTLATVHAQDAAQRLRNAAVGDDSAKRCLTP